MKHIEEGFGDGHAQGMEDYDNVKDNCNVSALLKYVGGEGGIERYGYYSDEVCEHRILMAIAQKSGGSRRYSRRRSSGSMSPLAIKTMKRRSSTDARFPEIERRLSEGLSLRHATAARFGRRSSDSVIDLAPGIELKKLLHIGRVTPPQYQLIHNTFKAQGIASQLNAALWSVSVIPRRSCSQTSPRGSPGPSLLRRDSSQFEVGI